MTCSDFMDMLRRLISCRIIIIIIIIIMALLGAWVCRLGVRPSEARCLSAAGLRSTVATAWLSVCTGCRACCCLSLSRLRPSEAEPYVNFVAYVHRRQA